MPDYFLKKKSLLDRFKDNHGRTGYIQSARAEHTWSNPIKRNRRTKELNGWIKSFAGKKHIRKLARFNTLNNGKNEGYNMENSDCLRYGSTLELPNGVCIPVNATIRCPRRAPFTFRITDIHEAEAGNPSKYVIRGYYPVYGPEQKPSDEFDIPCNDVSDIEQWIKTNEKGNSMQNEAMSLKGFIENLTEKLTKQFDLDLEEVQAYLDTHTQEMQELLDDKELSLKEKVLFVRSEIKGEQDEGYGGTKSVMSIWGNRPRDVYPEVSYSSVNDMYNTLLKYGYGDMHPIYYKNNSPEQIKGHILGYFKWTPTNSDADIEADALAAATMIKNNFSKSESKQSESLVLPNPTIIYRGTSEDAKKASHYISKILADKGLGWGRVGWSGPKNGEFHYGHPEKDVFTVGLRGSNDLIKDSFAVYKDVFGNDFWNNCDADPQGWVDPLTINRYDVATPRQESKGVDKKHEGFVGEWQSKIMQGLEAIKGKYGFDIESDEITDPRHGVTTVYDIIARNNGLTQSLAQVGPEYFHTYTDADFVYSKPFARKDYTDTEAISKLTKVIKDFYSQNPTMARSESKKPADEKLGYEKGHKNSKGENAPWVIRSHEDNRILASFANKKDAEEHLKRMKQYSKSESKQHEGLSNEKVKDAVKFAATEAGLENYLDVDSDGAMSVTVTLPLDSNELHEVRWVIDSNEGTIEEYLDTEKNHVKNFTDDESLVSMLTLLFQTTRMTLRNELPKKYKQSETKENGERCVDDYDTLTDGLSELGFVPSSDIRNGMIYPYRSRFTATKDGIKYHFWIHEDPSGEYTDYIEVWGGKFTTNGDPEDPETTKFNTVSDVLEELKSVKKSEAHDLDTYKSDVLSDLVVNLFHGEDWAKRLVDEYADAIEDAFARGDTSMEIATEIDTMAGKHESKNVSLKEIARTLDTAINKDGNYSVKDNTSGVTATDKDRTQTIRVSKDLKVELEDKDGKHSYEAQSLRDLSKYIRRAVKGEYVNEDFHKTQVKDAVYDVINRHNLNNAVKVSYLGNSVVCKYADRTLRIQPDLLTTMSTKDGNNVDTYPTNLKELDGYLDRVFGHYADELAESKQSEGIKLKLLDTITVPQWLWDAYTYSQEYSLDEYGVDLNDDEMAIFYDFKEKYKDCHLDDRGEEPDFHSRNDFDCYGGNCYVVDVYTKTDVKEKKSEKLFNKQELEALARGADILDQLQYRFSFSFYSPKTYTDAVDTALAMNAGGDKRIAYETIGDSEFRLYTDDPYNAIRFRDRLSNRAGISAEDLASTFRSAVGIRKNGGFATEDEQDTIGRYAAENYVSFSVSEDNSTMYVEGELPNVVEFFEAISSAEPA